jgi:hypothetical protein
MRTKRFNLPTALLLIVSMSACTVSQRLPPVEHVGLYPYGSEIYVDRKKDASVSGELIAAEWKRMVVFNHKTDSCIVIPRDKIDSYVVRFAKPRNYSATIPLSLIVCLAHGYFAVFTLPVNLITTVSVTAGAYASVRYTEREMPYASLYMFARFPQGIPPNIHLHDIHRVP